MFSIKESIRYGWEKFRANLEICLLTTLFIFGISCLNGGKNPPILLSLAVLIFSIILRIGYLKIFLKITDGAKPKFVEIFEEYKLFWRFLGTSVLYALIILGGTILLIIPGIIWAVRFSFASFFVVDMGMKPLDALKESYAITQGKFWKLLGFFLVLGIVNIVGAMAFLVGLLVSAPLSIFACIYVYRELAKAKAGLIQAPASTPSPQAA